MKAVLRLLMYLVAAILLLALGLAAYLNFSFDINDHRDRLTAEVERLTGRPLTIGGDISLSVFPWLGIEAEALSLGNLPQFGEAPLARVERIEARARLLPMLRGEFEVERIIIDGLALELIRTAAGQANWATLVEHGSDSPSPDAATDNASAAGGTQGLARPALAIGTLELRSARIGFTDLQTGARHVIDALDFVSAAIQPGTPFPLRLAFNAESGSTASAEGLRAELTLSAQANLDTAAQRLTLAGLEIASRIAGAGIPAGSLAPKLQGTASIDLATGAAAVEDLVLALDDSRIQGRVALTDPAAPALEFYLHADRLDVDRYLPAQAAAAPPSPGAAAAAGGRAAAASPQAAGTPNTLVAQGRLRIDTLRASGLTISAFDATVNADKGIIRLEPLSARLYGGSYQGKVALDTRRQPPRLSLDESLQGAELAPLLQDLTGAAARVTGRADVRARLQADAGEADVLKRSLAGRIELRVRDGAIKGVNVAQMMREASARLRGETAPASGANQTDFTELSANIDAARGVLRNDDLAMSSPLLRIGGAGSANLLSETIDYRLRTSLVATLTGQGGAELDNLRGVTVPIRITGSFAQPAFALDLDALIADTLRDKARGKIEEKLREKLPAPMQEQLPDKLREGLGRFLR
jgi:AsmA protein